MTEGHRDPTLLAMFTDARQDLAGEAFTAQVMLRTDKLKRRALIGRVFIGVMIAILAIPLEDAALLLSQSLVSSFIDLDDDLLAQILAPLNNIGALLALGLIGLRMAYRKIFS